MHDPGIFPDLVLDAGEHSNVDAVDGFDAFERGAEGLLDGAVGDAAGGEYLEGEAGFGGLAHDFVHARRVALEVDVAGHFHHFSVQNPAPLVGSARAVIDAARVEVHVPT